LRRLEPDAELFVRHRHELDDGERVPPLDGIEPLLALQPELVLLGTGPTQRFPSAALRSAFTARGVGLEAMDLGAACRTFNILVQEERRVAAVLFFI